MLKNLATTQWNERFPDSTQADAVNSLEEGQILFFPQLAFSLSPEEKVFLNPKYADPGSKNIGYDATKNRLWGVSNLTDNQRIQLKNMLGRYSQHAFGLIQQLLPHYAKQVMIGRTSYRPVEVLGRQSSYRKDDKRLHIDAFPSAPNQGKRILRVFCNINPNGESRVWHLGEPFEKVAQHFIPQIKKPFPGLSTLLNIFKITKSYRTLYDHYMLHMHDKMKADEAYQKAAIQEKVQFPPDSTWIVQTDHVSHAAMGGQFLLEQTFYLPIKAMRDESRSPLRVLEKMLNQPLV